MLKKKILFVCAYNTISGGNIMIFEHANRLQKSGLDVYITFKDINSEVPFSVFPHYNKVKIVDYKSNIPFDIVIASYWTTIYDLADFNADYLVYFSQCDERLFYDLNDPERCWVEQTYAFTNLPIITPAKFLTERYNSEFGADSYYVPYGMDLSKFNPEGRKSGGQLRVLIEGAGKAKIKRVDDAFQALEGIPNIEVWYVTYDGFVSPNWNADKVYKSVAYSEMPNIYRQCDILIKLSEVESFGLPNLEMMACGGAIITSDFTGHEEYAVEGKNSFIVPIGDVDLAKKRLLELINKPELLNNFKKEGVNTAKTRDWNRLQPDFASILEQISLKYPNGNRSEFLEKRLTSMSISYRAKKHMHKQLDYMTNWRNDIVKREQHLIYRLASKLFKLFT